MLTESEREELRAFTLYVRRCSVPLIRESDSQVYIEGTGTLFTVNSRHYLVTAAHVLKERIASNQLEQIGIRLGEASAEVSNLGKARIETFRQVDPFDVAIIRFDQPELIAALQKGWRFLTPNDLSPIRAEMSKCLIAGYPSRRVREQVGVFPQNSSVTGLVYFAMFLRRRERCVKVWIFFSNIGSAERIWMGRRAKRPLSRA
jgi:hypothetical protein